MTATSYRPSLEGAPWGEVTVGEVMHPGVIVCSPDAPGRHAAWLMATHRVHAVVVLGEDEEGDTWGVVTDADVLAAAAASELDDLAVAALVRTPLTTVPRAESLRRAGQLMHDHHVTHLLVTVRERPVGIVSTLDLVRAAAMGVGGTRAWRTPALN